MGLLSEAYVLSGQKERLLLEVYRRNFKQKTVYLQSNQKMENMLTTIKGIYKNGQIILEELPNLPEETQVVVTFLEQSEKAKPKKRIIGSMEGLFTVPDDFNDPLDDLKEYMY